VTFPFFISPPSYAGWTRSPGHWGIRHTVVGACKVHFHRPARCPYRFSLTSTSPPPPKPVPFHHGTQRSSTVFVLLTKEHGTSQQDCSLFCPLQLQTRRFFFLCLGHEVSLGIVLCRQFTRVSFFLDDLLFPRRICSEVTRTGALYSPPPRVFTMGVIALASRFKTDRREPLRYAAYRFVSPPGLGWDPTRTTT